MIIETQTLCPVCDSVIDIKQINSVFIVPNNCSNCKSLSSKIESMLNMKTQHARMERSYLKVDPRG